MKVTSLRPQILLLILLMVLMPAAGAAVTVGDYHASGSDKGPTQSEKIVNILVKSWNDKEIVAQDGTVYPINSSTQIINNTPKDSRIIHAEIRIKNGEVIMVILK